MMIFQEKSIIFWLFVVVISLFYFFWKHDFVAAVIPESTSFENEKMKIMNIPLTKATKSRNFQKIKNVCIGVLP